MDISDLATYIIDNTSLEPGIDFFMHRLPDGVEEGVVLQSLNSTISWDTLNYERFTLFLFLRSWSVMSSNLDTLVNLMQSKRGTKDGSWTVTGEINQTNYGLDDLQRFVSTISFTIAFKGV